MTDVAARPTADISARGYSHPDVLASGAVVVGKATRIPAGCEVGSGAVLAPDIGEARFAGGHVAAGATVEP